MALEDVLVTKLMALSEHSLRYESLLAISRALRERVDWDDVRARTSRVALRARVLRHARRPRGSARGDTDDRRPRDARACAHASRFGRRKRGVGANNGRTDHPGPPSGTRRRAPGAGSRAVRVPESGPDGVRDAQRAIFGDHVGADRGVAQGRVQGRVDARGADGPARRRRARPRRARCSDVAANGTRAVAVYACGPADLLEIVRLRRPVENKVVLDRTAFVEPLVLHGTDEEWLVLVTNRRAARLFVGPGDALEETDRIVDDVHSTARQGRLVAGQLPALGRQGGHRPPRSTPPNSPSTSTRSAGWTAC